MLSKPYQLLFLAVILLGAFYPAVSGEFCRIDDFDMLGCYRQAAEWSVKGIFIPGTSGGLYYRPILGTSFLIDKHLLGLDPALMHLHNVLLHLCNVVLVYLLARQLIPQRNNKSFLPLVTALCFGLHPITAESVNWISGRTDVLAGTFIFASALSLVRFRNSQKKRYFALSVLFFLLGALAKEAAVAFLAGFLLILIARYPDESIAEKNVAHPRNGIFKKTLLFLVAGIGVVLIFFLLRSLAFTSNYGKIGMTMKIILSNLPNTVSVILRAFGFYMKKLFIPYPLSFAIMEADPLYELLAIPLVLICAYIASRRTILSAMFIAGVFLVVPSFVMAFNQVAWTPYAERYLYLSSAFVAISTVLYLEKNLVFPAHDFKNIFVASLLLAMAVSTIQRSLIWQTNFSLFKDTVEKSPEARTARIIYGSLLAERGNYGDAMAQYVSANKITGVTYDEKADLCIAYLFSKRGSFEKAIKVSSAILEKTHGKSTGALDNLIQIHYEKMIGSGCFPEKEAMYNKVVGYSLGLYRLNHDALLLYNLGKASLAVGRKSDALRYFEESYRNLPDGHEMKFFSKRLLDKLQRGRA